MAHQVLFKLGLDDLPHPDFTTPGVTVPDACIFSLDAEYVDGKGPRTSCLSIGVTFRDDSGTEILGTCSCDVLMLYPTEVSAMGSDVHPSWKRLGTKSGLASKDVWILNVGGQGTLALRLYDVQADTATKVIAAIQKW